MRELLGISFLYDRPQAMEEVEKALRMEE